MNQRIQKILSRNGFGSRRAIEEKIRLGRIKINNKVAILGQCIALTDVVTIDDEPLVLRDQQPTEVLLFNKDKGVLCSTKRFYDSQAILFDFVPPFYQNFKLVGRLDMNTMGLIFLTNNGDLLYRLTHPKYEIVRVYMVRVYGNVTPEMIEKIRAGVEVDGILMSVRNIEPIRPKTKNTNKWFKMSLIEGKNREVRKIWNYFGCSVSQLIRISYGGIELDKRMMPNTWMTLSDQEILALKQRTNLK